MADESGTGEQLLDSIRDMLPLIESRSAEMEEVGHLTDDVHRALVEARVFRMWAPKSVGGMEIDLLTGLRIYEHLGTADGATAWTVMLGAGAGRFAAFFEPSTAKEIYGSDDAFVAGSATPSGTAREVDGGYVVDGRWRYGSGARHATWFTANCMIKRDGDEEGTPKQIRAVAVPASEVEIHATWSVTAMRGTGSEDFEITNRFVPARRTFSLAGDEPREDGPLYRLPFLSVAELAFGVVAAGIARGALDWFAALARQKKPTGSDLLLSEDLDVASRYGRAEATVRAASVYLHHSAGKMWKTVERGDEPTATHRADARLAAVDATARCARAVDALQKRSGMSSLYTGSAFGRAWRDLNAATQNMIVAFERYGDVGAELLSPR